MNNRIHILEIAPHELKGRLFCRRPADLLPGHVDIFDHMRRTIVEVPRPETLDETEVQARQRVRVGRQVALGRII